jgi:sulfoxide reductase heme-binding subunit YedZ
MSDTQALSDPGQHVFWLASRSLGIVAMLLVSLSVGFGLALSGRFSNKPGGPARLKTLHEATALVALIAIAGHGLLLIGDQYLRPGLAGVTIPFVLGHRTLWTGLGVIAGWLAFALGLSFYARRWIGVRRWRMIHRWTLAVYVLALVHTIGAGTDATTAWLVTMLSLTVAPVVVLAARRWQGEDYTRSRGWDAQPSGGPSTDEG